MRQNLLVSLALLFILPLAYVVSLWKGETNPACASHAIRYCDDEQGTHRETAAVEDEDLKQCLTRDGARLIEAGRTVSAQTLVDQLQRPGRSFELPQVNPLSSDSTDLFTQAKESVVVVSALYHCRKCVQLHATTASGFVIAREGIVVTNYHVVDNASVKTLVVMTSDRRVLPVEEVLAASLADDLAILKVAADDLVPLPLAASSAAAPVGSSVMVISHPDGQFYCCTAGIVSRYFKTRSDGEPVDAVAITADYARGSSGAPVLSNQGQVIGVVQSTESIYYTENGQQQRDLQMVFKTCIPAASVLKLVGSSTRSLQATAGNAASSRSPVRGNLSARRTASGEE